MTTQLIKLRGSPTISPHLPAPESCGRTTTKNLHYGNFLLSSPGSTQAASTEHYKHFTILDADAEDRNHKQTHLDKVVRPRKYQTKWFHFLNITPNPSRYNVVEIKDVARLCARSTWVHIVVLVISKKVRLFRLSVSNVRQVQCVGVKNYVVSFYLGFFAWFS